MPSSIDPASGPADGPLRRVTVVGVVRNDRGDYLLCRMPPDRGVFPGQWGLPGGGLEDGEVIEAALRREMREELGVEVADVRPLFFSDDLREKRHPDGRTRTVYMIHLLFECHALDGTIRLNEEFAEAAWVAGPRLGEYDLNAATRRTFRRLGLL